MAPLIDVDKMASLPSIVTFGFGGSGKTTLARMAADAVGWERTLWLNTDRPIEGFEYHEWTANEPWGVLNLHNATLETVAKTLDKAKVAAAQAKWMYDLYVLDGISMAERVNFETVKDKYKDGRKIWGLQTAALQELLWKLRSGNRSHRLYLGGMVMITAWVRESDVPENPVDEHGQPNTYLHPGVRGQFGTDIDYLYNQVLYVSRTGNNRKVHVKPSGKIHVKNDWEHVVKLPHVPIPQYGKGNGFVDLLKAHGLV